MSFQVNAQNLVINDDRGGLGVYSLGGEFFSER